MRGFGRGIVWLKERNLGRYWKVGLPQGGFLPGCWMKAGGENELALLELESAKCPDKLPTSAKAIWGNDR